MSERLAFGVTGEPVGEGFIRGLGRAQNYARKVRACCREECENRDLDCSGEVSVSLTMLVPFEPLIGSGKKWVRQRPDLDRVANLVLNALKGIAWRDDSQVVMLSLYKRYDDSAGLGVVIDYFD